MFCCSVQVPENKKTVSDGQEDNMMTKQNKKQDLYPSRSLCAVPGLVERP